jgi:hypothetical protein
MALSRNPCRYCVASAEYKGRHYPSKVECKQCKNKKDHEEFLKYKRKFEAGDPITDLNTLLHQEWVIFHGRTKHVETFRSMTIRTVESFLKNGAIHMAIRKEN